MEREELDRRIEDIAKSILSYSSARTRDHFEAEDLSQDIMVELYRSVENLRDERAFYGFMWAIAGNVYKNWCKKRAKEKSGELIAELSYEEEFLDGDDGDICLLQRELSLLDERYRRATVLYYIENKSCSEISKHLGISESMVKYLLFKSRQILKEGMKMERNYGTLSYAPKELTVMFWGEQNRYYNLCAGKRISQNILFACYNDKLTAEEISLQIGVALPYMESYLKELTEGELLCRDGNRYYTNIVIFDKELTTDISQKTSALRKRIADILIKSVKKHEKEVRDIGFYGCDMKYNTYLWQMLSFILDGAVIFKLQSRTELNYPKNKYGESCFVWGVENSTDDFDLTDFDFGRSSDDVDGDGIVFFDFPINGEMVHHYFYRRKIELGIILDIAHGKTEHFSENDKVIVADMIKRGYVINTDKGFKVNAPVFTKEQHEKLKSIFEKTAETIADEAEALMAEVAKIIKNHIPVHLKKTARDMAYLRLFDDAISAPMSIIFENKELLPYNGDGILPTTYIVLK